MRYEIQLLHEESPSKHNQFYYGGAVLVDNTEDSIGYVFFFPDLSVNGHYVHSRTPDVWKRVNGVKLIKLKRVKI